MQSIFIVFIGNWKYFCRLFVGYLVHNLTITANAGGMETSGGKLPDMRCGVLVQTSNPSTFENITLSNVVV